MILNESHGNLVFLIKVLSIHYDPVLWGPVDPNIFYPERFLTDRNPAAYLPFGLFQNFMFLSLFLIIKIRIGKSHLN